jgi:transposase
MRRGQQLEVPSPGQNSKVAAFGAINYATGEHRSLVPRVAKGGKNSSQFILFVGGLVVRARKTGKRVILALDNGPIHTSKKTMAFLTHPEIRKHIRVLWLPKYAPNLNDQERVWKVAKQQGVANVLLCNRDSLMDHVRSVLNSINAKPGSTFAIAIGRRRASFAIPKYLGTGT